MKQKCIWYEKKGKKKQKYLLRKGKQFFILS